MRSNYKKIGDYIREVNIRNTNLSISKLVGVSMEKIFISSVANIVDTDMSVYKVLKKGQLACKLMSVGRDEKLPVDLYQEEDPAIVSSAYYVFEPIDTNILHPEYLFMWLCRPENDRYIGYISGGDVRGGISWETFCGIPINVPTIEKQQEIVKEYNVFKDRIELNNKLIQKLEETAQAIYKQWFVDFEFPDENGKPYKSSGGEMVWCEELEKEIPKGWEAKNMNSLCEITSSKRIFEREYKNEGILFCRGKEITLKKNGETINDPIYISKKRYVELTKKYGGLSSGDILMTAVGTIGSTYMVQVEEFYFKDGNVIWFRNFIINGMNYYLYDFMKSEQFFSIIDEITIGSTQNAITIQTFGTQKIIVPTKEVLVLYVEISKKLNCAVDLLKKELVLLDSMKDLLLSKLATVN